jgi:hypothetical protein
MDTDEHEFKTPSSVPVEHQGVPEILTAWGGYGRVAEVDVQERAQREDHQSDAEPGEKRLQTGDVSADGTGGSVCFDR